MDEPSGAEPPRPPGFPSWDKLIPAFRAGMASQCNAEVIAAFQPVCSKFSEALVATLEAHDTPRLKVLGLMAAQYVDLLDSWIDATTQYAPDTQLTHSPRLLA